VYPGCKSLVNQVLYCFGAAFGSMSAPGAVEFTISVLADTDSSSTGCVSLRDVLSASLDGAFFSGSCFFEELFARRFVAPTGCFFFAGQRPFEGEGCGTVVGNLAAPGASKTAAATGISGTAVVGGDGGCAWPLRRVLATIVGKCWMSEILSVV
jgi:hypothetical protein